MATSLRSSSVSRMHGIGERSQVEGELDRRLEQDAPHEQAGGREQPSGLARAEGRGVGAEMAQELAEKQDGGDGRHLGQDEKRLEERVSPQPGKLRRGEHCAVDGLGQQGERGDRVQDEGSGK